MQSYDGFPLLPRNIADSFSSCVDTPPHHGQIRQNPPKLVQSPSLSNEVHNKDLTMLRNSDDAPVLSHTTPLSP